MFYGVVKDQSGRPVPGAIVSVVSGTGRWNEIGAISGPDGAYQLGGVEHGSYELKAMHPSFKTGSASVDASEGGPHEVNFTLNK